MEENTRIQYKGEAKRFQFMEEVKGARKDLYKVM